MPNPLTFLRWIVRGEVEDEEAKDGEKRNEVNEFLRSRRLFAREKEIRDLSESGRVGGMKSGCFFRFCFCF